MLYGEFQSQSGELNTWLDKAESALRESDTLPIDKQGSDAEIHKYKVGQL